MRNGITIDGKWSPKHKVPGFSAWKQMRYRCQNPDNPKYPSYGARGITVCERWESFENFIEDMGIIPPNRTLDRIDNDGNYEPDNCRWATHKEQQRNMRSNVLLTFQGKTQCRQAWADELGIHADTIRHRIQRGWSIEKTLSTPTLKLENLK